MDKEKYIEKLKELKEGSGLTDEMISKLSGYSPDMVRRIFNGTISAPDAEIFTAEELAALEKILLSETGSSVKEEMFAYKDGSAESEMAQEWPRQGEYTVADYYEVPNDIRVELIDGYIYDMASPTVIHQDIVVQLAARFTACVRDHKKECRVFVAPIDVRVENGAGRKDSFQPDLVIVCDPKKITKKNIQGAPDLCLEVLSPSTKKKDCTLKLGKYLSAGVREYWILDVGKGRLAVYTEKDTFPEVYRKGDLVPVSIYEGELKIDLSRIPWFGEGEEEA